MTRAQPNLNEKNRLEMSISIKLAIAFIDQNEKLLLESSRNHSEYLMSTDNPDKKITDRLKYKTLDKL